MSLIQFKLIKSDNNAYPFRGLMASTMERLEGILSGDRKEIRHNIEDTLFYFLEHLPQGKYRINNAGINHMSGQESEIWLRNKVPANYHKSSEDKSISQVT